jgi:hypothetical protein
MIEKSPKDKDLPKTIPIKDIAIRSVLREAQVESEARVAWGESVARETP